jgi:hypothetical protein
MWYDIWECLKNWGVEVETVIFRGKVWFPRGFLSKGMPCVWLGDQKALQKVVPDCKGATQNAAINQRNGMAHKKRKKPSTKMVPRTAEWWIWSILDDFLGSLFGSSHFFCEPSRDIDERSNNILHLGWNLKSQTVNTKERWGMHNPPCTFWHQHSIRWKRFPAFRWSTARKSPCSMRRCCDEKEVFSWVIYPLVN